MSDVYLSDKWTTGPDWSGIDTAGNPFLPVGYIQDFAVGGPVIAPPAPMRCPHCNRDWHTEPLTRRVADMVRNHRFDPTYKRAEDDSSVECVGSDTYGPNRDNSVQQRGYGMGIKVGAPWVTYVMSEAYVMATSYMQDMVTLITGIPSPKWPSFDMKTWFDEPYLPEPECPGDLPDVDVEFGPEHWPIEHVLALFPPHLDAVAQVHPDKWREPTPIPESSPADFSSIVEDFNKQYPTYPKGKTHEGI